jgi:hypothetical protein
MVTVYVVISISWLLVWYWQVQKEIDATFREVLKCIFPYAFVTVFAIAIAWFLTKGMSNMYLILIFKIVLTAFLYIGILWIGKSDMLKEAFVFLFKRTKKK